MIGNAVIGVLVFLSGFVLFEPAPSDLLLCVVVAFWSFAGLSLSRPMLPMIVLMLLYMVGGLLSFSQLDAFTRPAIYMATTAFLIISSIFFAAVIQTDTERRFKVIERSYIASAIVCALLGILGYFGAIPYGEIFTLYDRAKGAFKDPNVFGPFLVLPLVVMTRAVLTDRLLNSGWRLVGIAVLLAGVFLSFSRAAWGMAIVALLIVTLLAFVSEPRQSRRLRMVAYIAGGLLAVAFLLAILLSIPEVQELFAQRFKLVQSYDGGRLGRFERHIIGFFMIQELPFGLGPFEFGKMMGEDEHNMWLKGFTAYGWIGGFSYIALVAWTLVIAVPLLFRARPWTPFVQCLFAVYIGHLVVHNVIDNDHWRHLFLIYGLIWGAHALEWKARRPVIAAPLPAPLVFGPVALPRARYRTVIRSCTAA
ncbi:O-antigen ligase family protein [Kaistia adipata]|uniref:O-antigen ligase family protein n=1 Tax=Kaistia adipata TaxID=166954 RepID=UPI000421E48A|nr:O-antigen ligase family protein [Kaistia adipata]